MLSTSFAAGVDVRTVAGRLGHAGGGTTTLRVYSAWRDEADQRAAGNLGTRMPARPVAAAPQLVDIDPEKPHEKIAVLLRDCIVDGSLAAGLPIPSIKRLAAEHGVSVYSARQAVTLVGEWGLVTIRAGRPTLVRRLPQPGPPETGDGHEPPDAPMDTVPARGQRGLLDLEVRRLGRVTSRLTTEANPQDAGELRRLLVGAVKREGRSVSEIGDYEMVVRRAGEQGVLMTFVAAWA